jgi:hypothetical protein
MHVASFQPAASIGQTKKNENIFFLSFLSTCSAYKLNYLPYYRRTSTCISQMTKNDDAQRTSTLPL